MNWNTVWNGDGFISTGKGGLLEAFSEQKTPSLICWSILIRENINSIPTSCAYRFHNMNLCRHSLQFQYVYELKKCMSGGGELGMQGFKWSQISKHLKNEFERNLVRKIFQIRFRWISLLPDMTIILVFAKLDYTSRAGWPRRHFCGWIQASRNYLDSDGLYRKCVIKRMVWFLINREPERSERNENVTLGTPFEPLKWRYQRGIWGNLGPKWT